MPSEANLTFIKTAYGGLDFVCGGGSVVFRAVQPDGEMVAVKCYRDVSQRRCEVYRALQHLDTGGYVTPTRFHAGGLTLLWEGGAERVDVAVTPWLEGLTLDRKVAELRAAGDEQGLRQLLDELESMAVWLLAQPWAHGDLKPDNIIATPHGLRLIDCDAAYVPGVATPRSEQGTEGYRHPRRDVECDNAHIDDFALAVLCLGVRALILDPERKVESVFPWREGMWHRENEQWKELLRLSEQTGDARARRLCELLTCEWVEIEGLAHALTRRRKIRSGATAFCRDGRWGVLNPDGEVAEPALWDDIIQKDGRTWGVMTDQLSEID